MPDNASHPSDSTRGNGPGSVEDFLDGHGNASPPYNNLPFQITSLVGRARETSEVKDLLPEKSHLVTLTGPGGSGKTRLALAVAADFVETFEDGVWLVELAPLSDPELVPQAVASVLGVHEEPGQPLAQTLTEYLKTKRMLLVLDNCEHLIEACAALCGTLLRSCRDLRIVATSREALGIAGEVAWPTPPLSLPDPRHLPAVESLPQYEAARLFIERAAAVDPSFELDAGNAMAVVQVCYRFDRIPLAIELAAARVKVLAVEQISERLDESFQLLSGGGRGAMAHHRTLHATMEWSHELLSQEEQVLFRRLSVFAGDFSLEAAEAVCSGGGLEQEEVLDVLSRLVDKSLVVVAQEQIEGPRYWLLETVRQYGAEKLKGSSEEELIRRRHAEHYLALAEEAESELQGPRQVVWLERLEMEHDHLRAALRWALDPEIEGEELAELGLRLAVALWLFWNIRGLSEGHRWLEAALERSTIRSAARAKALNGAGWIALWQGDYDKGVAMLEEGLALFKELGDRQSAAISLAYVGMTVLRQGDEARIKSLREEAEALRREPLDQRASAELLFFLAAVAIHEGDLEQSVAFFEESLAAFQQLEDKRGISRCVVSLGMVMVMAQNYERAETLVPEGLESLKELKDKPGTAFSLLAAAAMAGVRGELVRAARLWGAAEALRETIGLSLGYQDRVNYDYEGRIAAARAGLDEAAWEAAWAEGRQMSPEEAVEYALQQATTPQEEKQAFPPTSFPAGLSAREVEVLRLVAKGMTNAEVARELFLSSRTVNWHLSSIYRKLGFSSRTEATRFALEHNLL